MPESHVYFSDRESGPRSPARDDMDETTWRALYERICRSVTNGDFGYTFRSGCPDTPSESVGTDENSFTNALRGIVPHWQGWQSTPDVSTMCDILEFCHRHIANASQHEYHNHYRHHHFVFDVASGQECFRNEVNTLLQRNGVALRMNDEGCMHRILGDPVGESILRAVFQTGDDTLNQLLSEAREKFKNPKPRIRQEALERAWDAWERLKTVKSPDKTQGIQSLIAECTQEKPLREMLETEAISLTKIGNNFIIRHFETDRTDIRDEALVDFVFQRMFSMLLLLLRKNNMLK